MPELPEVETTKRGIAPHITGRTVLELVFRTAKLRRPLDRSLCRILPGQTVNRVERRAKYLILSCSRGAVIIHLGMSGSLRVVPAAATERKHDHVDLILTDGQALRFSDPRKFGLFIYTEDDPAGHDCLRNLGPEPLGEGFTGDYLYACSRGKKQALKTLIMDQKIVVGVGNIYANEALFRAGIDPRRSAGRVGRERCRKLAQQIKSVLREAIAAGGTTISDFHSDGRPGYFDRQLQIYGRSGSRCAKCGGLIRSCRLGQRSTFYCPHCQH